MRQLAQGHYTEGAELIDSVLDVVRKDSQALSGKPFFLTFPNTTGPLNPSPPTLNPQPLKPKTVNS